MSQKKIVQRKKLDGYTETGQSKNVISIAAPRITSANLSSGKPLPRFFYVLERLLKNMASPGGRILILLFLVFVGLLLSWLGIPGGRELGSALFWLLCVLSNVPMVDYTQGVNKRPPPPEPQPSYGNVDPWAIWVQRRLVERDREYHRAA
jgi:hypothetical protein